MLTHIILLLLLAVEATHSTSDKSLHVIDPLNPYHQQLPDCTQPRTNVFKKTQWKGIVCPMVKDEVGFLSEWAAFYEMQGFDKVVFYDNNSTTPMNELNPWIATGFVEIVRDWWAASSNWLFKKKRNKFSDMMHVKFLAEVDCKQRAAGEGYDVFMSVDLDEYVFPLVDSRTLIDDLQEWFSSTTRGVMALHKLQFNPVPHFLEPVNLLTIEAFQLRTEEEHRMNYYTNVAPKVALLMRGGTDYNNDTVSFLVNCCDFHGCSGKHKGCKGLYEKGEKWKLEGKHKKWKPGPQIHHYARSLEKFMMKQRTWSTAGSHRDYDMFNFLDRASGFTRDTSALAWTCQLRELLTNRTGQAHYLRAGESWYRNPEFGKTVEEPLKRGRFGQGYGKVLQPKEMNPYPPGSTYQGAHAVYRPPPPKNTSTGR